MKSVELTVLQENNLLTICRELFPEYKFEITKIYDEAYDEDEQFPIKILSIYIQHEVDKFETINNVSWYEFASTTLLERMIKTPMMLAYESSRLGAAMFQKGVHIIDYLHSIHQHYKHFKIKEH